MKIQKLYIQFILLIGLSFCFNQQAFSKIAAYSSQSNEATFEQKENLQKRLRQQRKKMKSLQKSDFQKVPRKKSQAFKKKYLTKKEQGKNDFKSKLIWFIVLLFIAMVGAMFLTSFESLLIMGIGLLLLLIAFVGFWILFKS